LLRKAEAFIRRISGPGKATATRNPPCGTRRFPPSSGLLALIPFFGFASWFLCGTTLKASFVLTVILLCTTQPIRWFFLLMRESIRIHAQVIA